MKFVKIIFIPGNGGGNPTKDHWFPYVKEIFEKQGIEVISKPFPDSFLARQRIWLPYIEKLGADENTILIGHSSGAIAALRYAEKSKILGSVLVSGYHTDLHHPLEIASGYFRKPWQWDAIRRNQQFIIQFNSSDDDFIPIEEARFVHEKLDSDYTEFSDRGHFFQNTFPEIIEKVIHHTT
ncbi:MAG TPA: alpha/beta hydrolase [Candidatus Paceibacterota bacterium]|nr:alpha/beta hydrolase [Candidatus Paceibacterota bacterium]